MRIAAIYDIHANLPALEAVLQEVREVQADRIVVGGDVLPGPLPLETIQRLLDLEIPAEFIHGNGDREVLAQMDGVDSDWYRTAPERWREPVRWTAEQLQSRYHRLLSSWPSTYQTKIRGSEKSFSAMQRRVTTPKSSPASRLRTAFCRSLRDWGFPWWSAVTPTCNLIEWSGRHGL